MVAAILWRLYSVSFALVTLGVIAVYVVLHLPRHRLAHQVPPRDERARQRGQHQGGRQLLNFETVKYFANEEHEARRFDVALAAYERAAVKSQTTLSAMNIGQGIIIATGLVGVMILAARGIVAGTMTVGDFVLVNAYLVQLYAPLNQLGMVYRNIKQSLTDLEAMFRLLRVEPDIADKEDAPALAVTRGDIVFDHVSFRLRPAPRDSARRLVPRRAGPDRRHRRAERRRQVDHLAPAVPLLRCR